MPTDYLAEEAGSWTEPPDGPSRGCWFEPVDPATGVSRAVEVAERCRRWFGDYPHPSPTDDGSVLLEWDFADPPVRVEYLVDAGGPPSAVLVDPEDRVHEVPLEVAGVEALVCNVAVHGRGWA